MEWVERWSKYAGIMNLLYISYWGIDDPLTISSVMPSLPLLKEHLALDRLTLVTVERRNVSYPKYTIPYEFVDHVPITPPAQGRSLLSKAYEMVVIPRRIAALCKQQNIDLLYSRCSPAGAIAYKAHKRIGIPFIVDSYEPHADYMAETGEWTRSGFKYCYTRRFEKLQMRYARYLITLTESYRDYLEAVEEVPAERIRVIPCITNLRETRFSDEERTRVRRELGVGDAVTAVYAGKFGGLYYDHESFRILKDGFEYFDDFRVLLLTPTDREYVLAQCGAFGIPEDRVFVGIVPRAEVPAYLSAADYAYSFVRPHPTGPFQCPIKHGEYWACGLPFIVPDQISDDCKVMREFGGGALLRHDLSNIRACHVEMAAILADPQYRDEVRELAVRHKGIRLAGDVFSTIFPLK